jgi:hypothetical protein
MKDGPPPPPKSASAPATRTYVQVLLLHRNVEPLGHAATGRSTRRPRKSACRSASTAFGFGGNPITASGWPSFYIEEMVGHSQCQQTALASLVLEGVFERYPETENGHDRGRFGWAPSLAGGSTRVSSAAQRGAASQAPSVGISSATTSGGPRSRWKIRSAATICSR